MNQEEGTHNCEYCLGKHPTYECGTLENNINNEYQIENYSDNQNTDEEQGYTIEGDYEFSSDSNQDIINEEQNIKHPESQDNESYSDNGYHKYEN